MILLGLAWAVPLGDANLADGATVRTEHHTSVDLSLQVRLLGRTYARQVVRRHEQQSTLQVEAAGHTVTWSENRHRALEPGHAHDRQLPVVGRSYRVHAGRVLRLDGTAPSAEEVDIVGQVQVRAQLLGIRAMVGDDPQVGNVLPAGSQFAGILADAPGDPELVHGTLELQRVADDRAWFAVQLTLRSVGTDDRGTRISTDAVATGSLVIAIPTGLTELLDLTGTLEVQATRSDLDTTGQGTFRTTTRLEHR